MLFYMRRQTSKSPIASLTKRSVFLPKQSTRRDALTCGKSRAEPSIDRADQNELPWFLRRALLDVGCRRPRSGARVEPPAPPGPLRRRRAGRSRRWLTLALGLRLHLLDAHLRFTGRCDFLAQVERGGGRRGRGRAGDARTHKGWSGPGAVRGDVARAPDVLDELLLELLAERGSTTRGRPCARCAVFTIS